MNQVATLHKDMDQAAMAEMMGFSEPEKQEGGGSSLPRLKVMADDIQGETMVKGKKKKTVLVSAGAFALEVDGTTIYSDEVYFRCFMQQFFIKRWDAAAVSDFKGEDGKPKTGSYLHTIMTPKQWVDERIDDSGGINCGKPAGYLDNFSTLQPDLKDLIRKCGTRRVMFGEVTLIDPVDAEGNDVENAGATPCTYELSPSASKAMVPVFKQITESGMLPIERVISLTNEPQLNGTVTYYTPVPNVADVDVVVISDEDMAQQTTFVGYVKSWNARIKDKHHEKLTSKGKAETPVDDKELLNELGADAFIDVSSELD